MIRLYHGESRLHEFYESADSKVLIFRNKPEKMWTCNVNGNVMTDKERQKALTGKEEYEYGKFQTHATIGALSPNHVADKLREQYGLDLWFDKTAEFRGKYPMKLVKFGCPVCGSQKYVLLKSEFEALNKVRTGYKLKECGNGHEYYEHYEKDYTVTVKAHEKHLARRLALSSSDCCGKPIVAIHRGDSVTDCCIGCGKEATR